MGFVDHDNNLTSLRVNLDQAILQRSDERMKASFGELEFEFLGDSVENFVAGERGVGKVDGIDVLGQSLEQHPAEHCLAAAHFAADLDDSFVMGDGVDQCFQRGAAIGAREKEFGMRCDAEWRFAESEMFEIHHCSLARDSIRL